MKRRISSTTIYCRIDGNPFNKTINSYKLFIVVFPRGVKWETISSGLKKTPSPHRRYRPMTKTFTLCIPITERESFCRVYTKIQMEFILSKNKKKIKNFNLI